MSEQENTVCRVSLAAERMRALSGGWIAQRYHSSDGEDVRDFLSFDSVYEINPFEIGARHAGERRRYRERMALIADFLELKSLLRRPFQALSNGEMRRVMLAWTILRGASTIIVEGDTGGFDAAWCAKLRELAALLADHGIQMELPSDTANTAPPRPQRLTRSTSNAPAVVEMKNVSISFGKRKLFDNFSWTIREGERWALCGPNGSGKTTLGALICGDSPEAYRLDLKVFGYARGESGIAIDALRRKIAVISDERRAYLGEDVFSQLKRSLSSRTRLLILDEPCCSLSPKDSVRFMSLAAAWLDSHPRAAAICIEHDPSRIPSSFTLEKSLAVGKL